MNQELIDQQDARIQELERKLMIACDALESIGGDKEWEQCLAEEKMRSMDYYYGFEKSKTAREALEKLK